MDNNRFITMMSDVKNKGTKRRRLGLEHQLIGGIKTPPKLVDLVEPLENVFSKYGTSISFMVPTTDKDKIDVFYKVTINTEHKGVKYTCTCSNTLNNFGVCKHIRAVVIFMTVDLIKKQSQTDDTLELIESLNKFCIDNEETMIEETPKMMTNNHHHPSRPSYSTYSTYPVCCETRSNYD